ncbi:MAG: hypothetical protein AAGG11_10900, partial [Pseudomonadota bacterium]
MMKLRTLTRPAALCVFLMIISGCSKPDSTAQEDSASMTTDNPPTTSETPPAAEAVPDRAGDLATAEAFIDAFYSFD